MSAHEDFNRAQPVRASSDRSFGLVVGGVLVILGLMRHRPYWLAVETGSLLLLLAWIRPSLLHIANLLWIRLGLLLNKLMNPIVTGLLFLLVFTPMALLLRLLGKDPLRLRFDRGAASYWIERQPPGPEPESMANQF
jgi:hypothetical protein